MTAIGMEDHYGLVLTKKSQLLMISGLQIKEVTIAFCIITGTQPQVNQTQLLTPPV